MKIAILGAAGFIGRAAAVELSRRPEVGELILVDYVIRDAKRLAKALSPKCRFAMADVGKTRELERLLAGIDAVASAAGSCGEHEKPVLLACASMGVAAASIGDSTLPGEDRDAISASFRAAGVPAVAGCGMMPGWTELLSSYFLGADRPAPPPDRARYLFFSPDRFGGYEFMRSLARGTGRASGAPRGAPAGRYFTWTGGASVGVPEGKAGARLARISGTGGKLGPVGIEFAGALLLWLRGSLAGPRGTPAAVAGVASGDRFARVEDPQGNLGAVLLAEAAVRLAARPQKKIGLLPLPELIGREEAGELAARSGARIFTG
ncbi:MAG: hypothetical protein C4529_05515 [Deltaproteobacteria bacterium]|nr:MAG: hypothetical protein C4529_05515 [Deltaproteobacteria bacterium]